jgi:2-dehydro-3-deoxygluconokinase
MSIKIKSKAETEFDFVSLGEILLRFDPGDERIHNARSFKIFDGGAEYNVARNLAKVFRQRASIVTALADNGLGRLAEDLAQTGGVDVSKIIWREHDGIGINTRNGFYVIEKGFGIRPPTSCFDRGNTSVSQLATGEIDWSFLEKTRWFHTGGVFTGLSESTPEVAKEAMRIARKHGVIISFDLNYRDSLWKNNGGKMAANKLNREILPLVDVVFGVFDYSSDLVNFDENEFKIAAQKMLADFPNLKLVVSTLRETYSASRHDFGAVCFDGERVYQSKFYKAIDVLDRVGSGDAFASGFIYGLLESKNLQWSLDCGIACGALTMTTVGDASMSTLREILQTMESGSATVQR